MIVILTMVFLKATWIVHCFHAFVVCQFAAIFRNLIDKIAKDQTLQYILTMLDDALQVRAEFSFI